MTSHCSKCGSPIDVVDRYCGTCGQPISPAGSARDFGKTADAPQPVAHQSRSFGKVALGFAGALLLAMGGYQMMQYAAPTATDIVSPAPQERRDGSGTAMAPPPAPIAPRAPSEGDKPSEHTAPDVRAGPETEAQATPPPFNVPGLPADHPLNEALRNSPGLQNHPLFELFKNLPPPQGQETARAAQPESAAPNPRSNAGRGWLGVKLQEVDADMASALGLPAPQGAIVAEVVAGGPASEKLSPTDVILEINGHSVRNVADASARLRGHAPGEAVRLRVLRNGHRMLFAVRVGSWTDPLNSAK